MKLYLRLLWLVFTLAIIFFQTGLAASGGDSTYISVSVVKSDNSKPLEDAVVKIVPLTDKNNKIKDFGSFTDSKGVCRYNFIQPVIIQVSHIGYYTVTDTVYKPENKIYALVIESQNIKDVVVTGQYGNDNTAQKSVYDVKVIDADMIRAKGANNLREALENELNIDFGQDPVFGGTMGINGISGEGVKIMVDGVPLLGRLNGQIDLEEININNIERIEIIEGPLSVMYGTDAMGGVINIITKSNQAQKVNVSLKGYYESVGQYNAELDAGFSFKKSQIFLSGGRNFFGGYSPYDTVRFKLWKPREQYFADAKYLYTGNRFRLTLSGSFFREEIIDKGGPTELPTPDGDSLTYGANDLHYLTYRGSGAAAFMYRFKDAGQLDVLASYSGFVRYTNDYFTNLVTLQQTPDTGQQDTTKYHQIEVRATYNMSAWKNRLNFLFGIDATQEYAAENIIQGGHQQVGDYATFGSVRISIVEGLDIQPAVRFSYNTLFTTPLIPSLNLRYSYKNRILFRASYGRGFRAPSLDELYLDFVDIDHNLHGNPGLKPEDGNTVSTSLTYTQPVAKHTLIFTVSGFYNNIKNEIDWGPLSTSTSTSQVTDQYINLNRYITFGGRANIGYRWNGIHAEAAVQITNYNMTDSTSNIKLWSPDFTFNAGYMIPKILVGINGTFKYDGLKPVFVVNTGETGTRDAYSMLSLSATKNFWKDRIQVTVGGKNLLNVTNVLANNVTGVGHDVGAGDSSMGWGRTFFVTLVLKYSK